MMNSVVFCSHVGNSRDGQEDSALLPGGWYPDASAIAQMENSRAPFIAAFSRDRDFVAAVSDGMGGHACGEVASYCTVKYLSDHYAALLEAACIGEKAISELITRLNSAVSHYAASHPAYKGMGATLCGVVGYQNRLYGFNAGDSRLYAYFEGSLRRLSIDHTEGQRLLDLGLLTEQEVAKFPRRKNLCRYIGHHAELIPDVFLIPPLPSASLLMLCSDGLSDVVTSSEIETVLSDKSLDLSAKAGLLLETALGRNPGRGDNVTVILIEI